MRTTVEAVSKVVEVDLKISTDLEPFIEVANAIVTEVCAPLGNSADSLERIERYLAAHFYAIRDNAATAKSEGVGPISVSYGGQYGLYLSFTKYGQMAIALDTKGGLASYQKSMIDGSKRKPSVGWAGTVPKGSLAS